MNKKVSKKAEWINPITKEKETIEAIAEVTDDFLNHHELVGDAETYIEFAINSELSTTMSQKSYDAIEKYAVENGRVAEKTIDSHDNEYDTDIYRSGKITDIIRDACSDYTSPVIKTNMGIAYAMSTTAHYIRIPQTSLFSTYYKAGTLKLDPKDDDEPEIETPVYVDALMPLAKMEVLIYDENDPLKCELIRFNTVIS